MIYVYVINEAGVFLSILPGSQETVDLNIISKINIK